MDPPPQAANPTVSAATSNTLPLSKFDTSPPSGFLVFGETKGPVEFIEMARLCLTGHLLTLN
jgi:hypothetical protein